MSFLSGPNIEFVEKNYKELESKIEEFVFDESWYFYQVKCIYKNYSQIYYDFYPMKFEELISFLRRKKINQYFFERYFKKNFFKRKEEIKLLIPYFVEINTFDLEKTKSSLKLMSINKKLKRKIFLEEE